MFVLTVDRRGSRRQEDHVDGLVTDLAERGLVRPFERIVDNRARAVADDPAVVVDVILELVRRGGWLIGLGIGSTADSEASDAAHRALRNAKDTVAGVAVVGVDTEAAHDAEAALTLLALLESRRTPEGHEAVTLMRERLTRSDAARRLGITPQAMSQRLTTAGWQAEGPGRILAERLLRRADA